MKKLSRKQRRLRAILKLDLKYLISIVLDPIVLIIYLINPKFVVSITKIISPFTTQERLRTNMNIKQIYLNSIAGSLIALGISFILPKYSIGPLFKTWDFETIVFDIVSGLIALVQFNAGLICIGDVIRAGDWPKSEVERVTFFSKPLSYQFRLIFIGTFLSFIGTHWIIWLAITISGIIGMLLTFPTKNRFKKWEKMRRDYIELNTPSKG